jgi:hypothetical protein
VEEDDVHIGPAEGMACLNRFLRRIDQPDIANFDAGWVLFHRIFVCA